MLYWTLSLLISQTESSTNYTSVFFNPYCSYTLQGWEIECIGFTRLSALSYIPANFTQYTNTLRTSLVTMKPREPIVLSSEGTFWIYICYQIYELEMYFYYMNSGYDLWDYPRYVEFHGFSGFDLNLTTCYFSLSSCLSTKPQFNDQAMYQSLQRLIIRFFDYGFNFYQNGSRLWPSELPCNQSLLYKESSQFNFFNLFSWVYFSRLKHSSSVNVCPFIFKTAWIQSITYTGMPVPSFDTTNYDNLNELNSNIFNLYFNSMYKLNLTKKILHKHVFKNLSYLSMTSMSLSMIERDVFESFTQLKILFFNVKNLKYLVHETKMEWLNSLNSQVNLIPSTVNTKGNLLLSYVNNMCVKLEIYNHLNDESTFPRRYFPYLNYDFPDEDFCLFSKYPHNQLVVTAINGPLDNCNRSCTLEWIYKYAPVYLNELNSSTVRNLFLNWNYYTLSCENLWRNNKRDSSCDFDRLFEKCSLVTDVYEPGYFNLYDLRKSLEEVESVLLKIIGPILSACSVLSNILILVTCLFGKYTRQKEKKNKALTGVAYQEERMNYFLLLNSVLCILFSLLFLFKYTLPCNAKFIDGLADFAFRMDCFYKDTGISYLFSVLKLLSNLCLIQYSLNRYALVNTDKESKLVRMSAISFKKLLAWGVLVSCLLSVMIYFQITFLGTLYGNDFIFDSTIDYNYYFMYFSKLYNNTFTFNLHQKVERISLYVSFTAVYDLASYFSFCLAICFIEVKTLINFGQLMRQKEKISSIDRSKEMKKAKQRNTRMVLVNTLVNVSLRFPELTALIFFLIVSISENGPYMLKNLCSMYNFCLELLDLDKIFFMISLSMSFFIQLKFNSSFRTSFFQLKGSIIPFLAYSKKRILV